MIYGICRRSLADSVRKLEIAWPCCGGMPPFVLSAADIRPVLEYSFTKAAEPLGLLTGQYREGVRYEERLIDASVRDPRHLAPLQTPAMAITGAALYETEEMTEGQLADSLLVAFGFFPGFIQSLAKRFKTEAPAVEREMLVRIASLYRKSEDKHKRQYHVLLASNAEAYAWCMREASHHMRETDDAREMSEALEAAIEERVKAMPVIITIDAFFS